MFPRAMLEPADRVERPVSGRKLGGSLAIALVGALLGCENPPTTPLPPDGGGVCTHLAYVFYVVARNRDRGLSREGQTDLVTEGVVNPFTTDPEATRRSLLHVVDLVYRTPMPRRSAHEDEVQRLDRARVRGARWGGQAGGRDAEPVERAALLVGGELHEAGYRPGLRGAEVHVHEAARTRPQGQRKGAREAQRGIRKRGSAEGYGSVRVAVVDPQRDAAHAAHEGVVEASARARAASRRRPPRHGRRVTMPRRVREARGPGPTPARASAPHAAADRWGRPRRSDGSRRPRA